MKWDWLSEYTCIGTEQLIWWQLPLKYGKLTTLCSTKDVASAALGNEICPQTCFKTSWPWATENYSSIHELCLLGGQQFHCDNYLHWGNYSEVFWKKKQKENHKIKSISCLLELICLHWTFRWWLLTMNPSIFSYLQRECKKIFSVYGRTM